MRISLIVLPLGLTLAACAPVEPAAPVEAGHRMAVVRVTATYRERILLTPGHVLKVRIEDVSRADAPAEVLAEHTETLDGRGPPYEVTLGFPSSQVDPRHTYAARAEIREAEGALRFVTDTRYVVLTQGARNEAEIVMVSARP